MTLSAEKKQQIIDALASGLSESKAAKTVGCSRSTVQRIKQDPQNRSLLQIAKGLSAQKRLTEQGDQVAETLNALVEREPQMQDALWLMFEGLTGLFSQVLAQTSPDDVSPRQLPALARSAAEIATAYANFADRVNGLEVLADEIGKISQAR